MKYQVTERYRNNGHTSATITVVDDSNIPQEPVETDEYDEYQTNHQTRAEAEAYAKATRCA